MSYTVLKQINLEGFEPTGKTRHFFGNELLSKPSFLQIAKYDDDPGYYLFYLDSDKDVLTDTYHETIDKAFEQAEWEFGIKLVNWSSI